MLVLISPKNVEEAIEAVEGGADIVDVKNPSEGSLGANFPWVIREIANAVKPKEVSATVGDIESKPGTASLAAYAASIWADYVKAGLLCRKLASDVAYAVVRAVKENGKKAVIAGYADYYRVDALSPMEVLEVACDAGADVVMIDTAIKDGKGLFDHMDFERVAEFADKAHEHGMLCALAGSLKTEDIPKVKEAKADIVGVRGAVCDGSRNGKLRKELVKEFVTAVKS